MTGGTRPAAGSEADQLRGLTEVGRALTYTTSLDQVARLIVERGATLLGAPAAVLMLADADGHLQLRAAHGVTEANLTRFRAPLGDEVLGRLQGLLDVGDDRFLAVPLVVAGAVTGLVAVALAQTPSDSDEWLLSALADQAATALESARLSGEVRLELEGRLRDSEGATNAKDRALATLAHDIRSPLGAIDGYCSNLEEGIYGDLTDGQRQALGRVRMSGKHLLALLETVMDLARLHAGVAPGRVEPVHCAVVAREAMDILAPAATAKLQALRMGDVADLVVNGDGDRLRQVLVNLLGNAVKFTPEGGTITMSVERRDQDRAAPSAVISVTDTGPGIAEKDQAAIFEAYYRSEDAHSLPGVGLGLAISAALIDQMGGSLRVVSTPGAGATFLVELPLVKDEATLGNETS